MSTVAHPEYLDDDGNEGVQFVRYDLAETENGAKAYVIAQGLYHDWGEIEAMDVDAVWMRPAGEGTRGDEWYDIVPAGGEGVVRYWRLRP